MTDLMRTLYDYIHDRHVEKYFVDAEYYRVQQVIRLRQEELLREFESLGEESLLDKAKKVGKKIGKKIGLD